jgi:dihydroxyacetone kinase-like predicted kinase
VRLWFRLSADALDRSRSAIDMLNVFPVPDSDTGTNLHRTIASAADALAGLPSHASNADVWQAAATAALRGACGNSGIIVSQLLRGLADTCGPAAPCDGQVVALALARAAILARAAVHRPLEGTVLTVADAAARAAARATRLPEVGMAAALGARQALVRTEQQLGILAASGVVDAGGAGLCVLLDALSAAICGTGPPVWEVPVPGHVRQAPETSAAGRLAYEVTFLLDAAERAVAGLRAQLDRLGDSLVVSGRDALWHVHIHVADAGAVIEAGLAAGRLSKITITCLNGAPAATAATRPVAQNAVVTVADGHGLRQLLAGAGATLLAVAEASPSPAAAAGERAEPGGLDRAGQAAGPAVLIAQPGPLASQWPAGWPVIEIGCPVQSLAALAVHDPLRDRADDVAAMRRAVAGMRWATVAAADGDGPDQAAAAVARADLLLEPGTEMLTLVTGQAAEPALGAVVAEHVASVAPAVDVVCYDGGMTSAVLLIGAE